MLEIIASCHPERFVLMVRLQPESQGQLGFSLFRRVKSEVRKERQLPRRGWSDQMNGMSLLAASNLISLIPGLTCMFQVVKFLAALYRVPEGLPSCLPACVRVQCEHGISSLKGEGGRGHMFF